jgi:hypothetical protein
MAFPVVSFVTINSGVTKGMRASVFFLANLFSVVKNGSIRSVADDSIDEAA